jgi:hypothetical protein
MEKITGESGDEINQMTFRDVRIDGVRLPDGRTGTKVIKLVDGTRVKNPMEKAKLADELSVEEMKGEEMEQPTYAIAMSVDSFYDYNFEIQVVKNSSYERNEVLDQAVRHEYANWRLGAQQFGVPVDAQELVDWVDESYDIDSDRFRPKGGQQGMPMQQQPGQPQQGTMPQAAETQGPAKQMAPAKMPAMGQMM